MSTDAYRKLLATGRTHEPGQPCWYCGKPNPPQGPCPDCWTPITVADAKAIFAEDGLSVDIRTEGR